MAFFYYFCLVLFLLLCFLLCGVVMMQESKSSGLGASLGGGDTSESIFGTATADVLKRFTGWLIFLFLVSCVVLSLWTAAMGPRLARRAPVVIEQDGNP